MLREVGGAVLREVRGAVLREVGGAVLREVGGAVLREVRGAVLQEVGGAVLREVGGAVLREVRGAVLREVGGAVLREVRGAVLQEVGGAVLWEVRGAVLQEVGGSGKPVAGGNRWLGVGVVHAFRLDELHVIRALAPGLSGLLGLGVEVPHVALCPREAQVVAVDLVDLLLLQLQEALLQHPDSGCEPIKGVSIHHRTRLAVGLVA